MTDTDFSSVKVAVRVRPLNHREIEERASIIVHMENKKISIRNPKTEEGHPSRLKKRDFYFDYCFWSVKQDTHNYASQKKIFEKIGKEVLISAFDGYNVCILAYGQSGSGKSYTMLGTDDIQFITGTLRKIMASEDPSDPHDSRQQTFFYVDNDM
ncbi:Kinesin-like protein KIF1B [Nymphon striatum]|nr:Kinesin-like protein KIF1B [Nymphon striatum]